MTDKTRTRGSKPAVGYARRSTDRQEQSLGDQRKVVEAYAQKAGYGILDWYTDDAISGAGADDRAAFLRMIQDAQQPNRPFDYILVYDVKRFGRLDNDETGHYRYLLRKAGVEVVYVAENFNGDDTDDLLLPVKQWQARQELRDLSKVTIRGLLSKADDGSWMGGTPPFGYDLAYYNARGEFLMVVRFMPDGTKQVLNEKGELQRVINRGDALLTSKQDRARLVLSDPARVAVVREMFRLYVRDGLGYKKIADHLNGKGIPSPRNGQWSEMHSDDWAMTSIRDILMNPAYAGDAVWNRRSFAKFHKISGKAPAPTPKVRRRAIDRNGEQDWIVTRDAHAAIVPRAMFEKSKALRRERRRRSTQTYRGGRGAKSRYLLTGVIVCERCGHRWQGYTTKGGKPRKDGSHSINEYYACGGYVMKGTTICERDIIRRDMIEGLLVNTIGNHIRRMVEAADPSELRGVVKQYLGVTEEGASEQLLRLREQREQVRAKINNILDNLTRENREFADQRIAELKQELMDISPKIEELERAAGAHVDLDEAMRAVVEMLRSFADVMKEGTIDEQRRVIRAFVRQVRLDPQNHEGRAEVFALPDFASLPRFEPAISDSSFHLVAGAGFEPAIFRL